ncbi:response regulator [Specibacter cremeus]|uniref:response regulator n=1 Tax=Specibacter cremeus TaxID=1629051 RepID=UPI000F7813A0|nr:response regulator [Specibacter cremeus]
MIRTLVVDDDFRVAGIHAARVARVDGFECIGQAHTGAAARAAIERLHPDLLLLDVYLPDESGIALLRSLQAAGTPVDAIIITAARDLETVRNAMSSGAVYYLVKPFGFEALRVQLEAYRRWTEQLAASGVADQATIDSLYKLRQAPAAPAPVARDPRGLQPTMAKVFDAVRRSPTPIGAAEIAERIGISRPTAQRYLGVLERREFIALELSYGATGRPVNTYVPLDRPR